MTKTPYSKVRSKNSKPVNRQSQVSPLEFEGGISAEDREGNSRAQVSAGKLIHGDSFSFSDYGATAVNSGSLLSASKNRRFQATDFNLC